jgi:hypothetical protein
VSPNGSGARLRGPAFGDEASHDDISMQMAEIGPAGRRALHAAHVLADHLAA